MAVRAEKALVPTLLRMPPLAPAMARVRVKPLAVVAAGGAGLVLLTRLQRASPVKKARQDLLAELAEPQLERKRVDVLVDQLMEAREPFNEALIGNGPWQVVYSRGPLPWQQWTAPGWLVGASNKASQEFIPQGRRVINRGQVLGNAVIVTAEGTYEPQAAAPEEQQQGQRAGAPLLAVFGKGKGEGTKLPQVLRATITSGTLHIVPWKLDIPLPIRGTGTVELTYCDDSLRVFKGSGGAVTVQVREDRLGQLIKPAAAK
ncbi:hypothetical protein N2152v2_008781 [Parachlorella kessleri]